MTPLMIEMMLWFYYSAAPWPRWYDAQRQAIEYFLSEGLVEPSGDDKGYRLTSRGAFYVDALMAVQPPSAIESAA